MKTLENTINKFIEERRLSYENTARGKFVKFREYIHDLIRSGNANNLSTPISAFWAITSGCNLCCKHCYAIENKCINELSFADCLRVIDIFYKWNVLDITFEGGEPFTKSNFLKILKYTKEKNFIVDILTNGTKIDNVVSNELRLILNHKMDRIQVSLDGDQVCSDYIRGSGNYEKTILCLESLKWLDNVTVNTVVTNKNIHSLYNMCEDILSRTNVNVIHFSPLMKIGNGKNNEYPEINEAISVFLDLKRKFENDIIISGTPIPDRYILNNPRFDKQIPDQYWDRITLGCCAGRSKIFVNADGCVYPCTFLNCKDYMSGNIIDDNFETLWNNKWNDLREISYQKSLSMKDRRKYTDYCPGIYMKSK